MKNLKYKKCYKVKFDDHAKFGNSLECEIVGWYLRSDKKCHVFTWWFVKTEDEEDFLENVEEVAIVKTAIISIKAVQ